MTKVAVYNQTGNKTTELELNEVVFGLAPKRNLIHQVYVSMRANVRQPWADTKDKGEVRGGGKKPWKQKGTGRARHGSIRSPIWRGGGITFGPLSARTYLQKINKKVKVLAVKMCLSDKVKNDRFIIVESFEFGGKTKTAAQMRTALPGSGKKTLIIAASPVQTVVDAVHNIAGISVARAEDVNVIDLLHHQYVLTTPEAIKVLETRFVK